jgi:hypothetical protein
VTYSIYVSGASAAQSTLGDTLEQRFTSVGAVAIQIALVLAIAAFVMVPWARILKRDPTPPADT